MSNEMCWEIRYVLMTIKQRKALKYDRNHRHLSAFPISSNLSIFVSHFLLILFDTYILQSLKKQSAAGIAK